MRKQTILSFLLAHIVLSSVGAWGANGINTPEVSKANAAIRASFHSCIDLLSSLGQFKKGNNVKPRELPLGKPGLIAMEHALSTHFHTSELTVEMVNPATFNFLNLIDPYGFLITKEEFEKYTSLNESLSSTVLQSVFREGDNYFYEQIFFSAKYRLNNLVELFKNNSEFRNEILNIAKSLPITGTVGLSDDDRPQYENQILDKFKLYFARSIQSLVLMQSQTHQGADSATMIRDAYLIAIRSEREFLYRHLGGYLKHSNLPLLIMKSYIQTFDPRSDVGLENASASRHDSGFESSTLGIGVYTEMHAKGYLVRHIVPNSPAHKNNIKAGDIITHIKIGEKLFKLLRRASLYKNQNWVPVRAISRELFHMNVTQLPVSSPTQIKILREGEQLEVQLPKEQVTAASQSIRTKIVPTDHGNIAYMRLSRFYGSASKDLRATIDSFKKEHKITGLLLDLRDNPGGYTKEMIKALGIFVPSGPAMIIKGRDKVGTLNIPQPNVVSWDGPMVVLTNEGTASAAEALSQALKDYGRAIIVGSEQTYGKGTGQDICTTNQMELTITTSMFYTASGVTPQLQGVKSDIVLPLKNKNDQNLCLEKDHENAIQPPSSEFHPQLMLRRLEHFLNSDRREHNRVVSILTERVQERHAQFLKKFPNPENLSDAEIIHHNSDEAFDILQDLITLKSL